jgi:hypothetical protein
MSELDKVFGAKEGRSAESGSHRSKAEILARALQGGSRWNCEDRIKGTLDAFIEAAGEDWMPRSDVGRRSMYASARPIVDEIGEDQAPPFVRWAVGVMRRKGLDVKDLRSLAFLIPAWRKDQGGPAWMRTACTDCHTYHPADEMCRDEPDDDDREARHEALDRDQEAHESDAFFEQAGQGAEDAEA